MTTCPGCSRPIEPLAQIRTYHSGCDPMKTCPSCDLTIGDGKLMTRTFCSGCDPYAKIERLKAILEAYEQWEADMIQDNDVWYDRCREPLDTPSIPQKHWDRLIEIQGMRNKALGRFAVAAIAEKTP